MHYRYSIKSAIEWCKSNHILEEFLRLREPEVIKAMALDYSFERQIELTRRDTLEEGKAEGKAEFVLELLMDVGGVNDELKDRILSERNPETLSKWRKIAAKSNSVEEFLEKAKLS